MEMTTAIAFFDNLLEVFGFVKAGQLKRDEQVDSALRLTHRALVETQAYVRINNAQSRNQDKEYELARLWYEASIPMRHVDKHLAATCSLKGGYWSNPEEWGDVRSGKADISLANVEKLTYELLTGK